MDELSRRLQNWMERNERSLSYVAKRMDVSKTMVMYLLRGERKWTDHTRKAAEHVLEGNNK